MADIEELFKLSRREFLGSTALAAAAAAVGSDHALAREKPLWFQHGVASGDPTSESVVLWTRVTPLPEATPGSGLGPDTTIEWHIAAEPGFSSIVQSGTATSTAAKDHTIHVEPTQLTADTEYFYRFIAPDGTPSPIGRTATTMLFDAPLEELKIAVASCANWESGFFAAYQDLANRAHKDEIDILVFLGDYIYEYGQGEYTGKNGAVRNTEPPGETTTLEHYRIRYGLHRSDHQLQAAHAALPWIVMWDDHESADNSWREGAKNHQPSEGSWELRKQASWQAYLEWMPVRYQTRLPGGKLYRSFTFGNLASLSMLDLRSFRDVPTTHEQWLNGQRSATMMGTEQFSWLKNHIEDSASCWNIVGSSVLFAPLSVSGRPAVVLPEPLPANFDQWDGYSQERDRLLAVLADSTRPALFLTGDIHSEWANDLIYAGRHIGVELVCSSISSPNVNDQLGLAEDNAISVHAEAAIQTNSPHVRHVDIDAHGYGLAVLRHDNVQLQWIRVEDVTQPDSTVSISSPIHWSPDRGFAS